VKVTKEPCPDCGRVVRWRGRCRFCGYNFRASFTDQQSRAERRARQEGFQAGIALLLAGDQRPVRRRHSRERAPARACPGAGSVSGGRIARLRNVRSWLTQASDCGCEDLGDCELFAASTCAP
jgi:predicted RNA-binding Zn-ribbon protein involved in translation (DUF1610 family)